MNNVVDATADFKVKKKMAEIRSNLDYVQDLINRLDFLTNEQMAEAVETLNNM